MRWDDGEEKGDGAEESSYYDYDYLEEKGGNKNQEEYEYYREESEGVLKLNEEEDDDSWLNRWEACSLCRRPFLEGKDDEQTEDMLGRARKGPSLSLKRPWRRTRNHVCNCTLCSDCWLSKASDNKCPLCGANISRWRVRIFFADQIAVAAT